MKKKNLKNLEKFKRFLTNLSNDVWNYNGGWIFFGIRMFINCVFLYVIMMFLVSFYYFTFASHGLGDPKYFDVIRTLLWAIGILFIAFKGFQGPFVRKDC